MASPPRRLRCLLLAILLAAADIHAGIAVQGHRGARALRPENTLAAFQYALEVGVDTLELDLVVSSDNVLVITHDLWINPDLCLKNGNKLPRKEPVIGLSLQQIKQYDCGSLKNPRFPDQVLQPGERIPTLRELFKLVEHSPAAAARTVKFNIETKIDRTSPQLTPTPQQYAKLLVEQIHASPFRDRVIVQSFDYRTLKWIKQLDAGIPVSQLSRRSFVDLVAAARSVRASYVSPNWESITRDMVEEFHASDLKVVPWTANSPAAWDHLVEIGVDEIITDDPQGLINYLKSRNLR